MEAGRKNAMAKPSTYTYQVPDHHLNSCQQIYELWRKRDLCDINLIAENDEGRAIVSMPVHRVVLAANIPYFRAMFASNMQESSQLDITIKNMDSEGLKRIVGFAYSGKLEITEQTSQGILTTASLLNLPNIVSACARFIGKRLSPANCLGTAEFARLHHLEALVVMTEKYAFEHFAEVAKHDEFLAVSVNNVEKFVSSDEISVRGEEEVYDAVTRWILYDVENREEYADQLYGLVRFPILSHDFLNKIASNNSLLQSLPAGKIMLQDALDYHENPATALCLSSKKIQPRSSVAGILCVAGGTNNSGQSLNDVSFFNAHGKVWKQGTKMNTHRNRMAMALYCGELYAIGGVSIVEPLATVEKYSPADNSWRSIASLNTPRRSCVAVATKAGIYVLGGFNGHVFLKSVELYDVALDEWHYQQPMQSSRSELATVLLNQRIYAIGGANTLGQLRSVERFDLINRKWENVADMCAARANCASALLGLEIFVAGGMMEKELINMAEIYNPELDQWEVISARMSSPRVGLCMVSMGNMIYVMGGSNGSEYLDSVECYDPSKLQWIPMPSLPIPCFGAAAVLLSNSDHIAPEEEAVSPPMTPSDEL